MLTEGIVFYRCAKDYKFYEAAQVNFWGRRSATSLSPKKSDPVESMIRKTDLPHSPLRIDLCG